MGWIMIPAPGQKYGPCTTECAHRDCAANRKDAARVCRLCGKPIGYDSKCFRDSDHPTEPDGSHMVHAVCVWTAEEGRPA